MANRNGTPGVIGQDSPVKPNAGINLPVITGAKIGKGKSRKTSGKSKKTFKNAQGTKSGVMRTP